MNPKPCSLDQTEATTQWFDDQEAKAEQKLRRWLESEKGRKTIKEVCDRWWEEHAATISEVQERMEENADMP